MATILRIQNTCRLNSRPSLLWLHFRHVGVATAAVVRGLKFFISASAVILSATCASDRQARGLIMVQSFFLLGRLDEKVSGEKGRAVGLHGQRKRARSPRCNFAFKNSGQRFQQSFTDFSPINVPYCWRFGRFGERVSQTSPTWK